MFDRLEKQFYPPLVFLENCARDYGQFEVVGEEHMGLPGFLVVVFYQTDFFSVIDCWLLPCRSNDLVAEPP